MQLNANQAFYLLVNNKSIASMSTSMAEIYRDDKVIQKYLIQKFS
jgi:microtubule-associated protein 1 light chain